MRHNNGVSFKTWGHASSKGIKAFGVSLCSLQWSLLFFIALTMVSCRSMMLDERMQNELMPPRGSDLPAGGRLVINPTNSAVMYYYTIRQIMERLPQKNGCKRGLWESEDAGNSWFMIGDDNVDFNWFFIHPKTGIMYAVLCFHLVSVRDKEIHFWYGEKLAISRNRGEWLDITDGGNYDAQLGPIFSDPDHEGRICVFKSFPGAQILQSVDDDYSRWTVIPILEWEQKHPGCMQEIFSLPSEIHRDEGIAAPSTNSFDMK
jgi:hypothetical protein